MTAKEERDGIGVEVENVQWGPRGPGVVAAWLIGWGMRIGLLVMGLPCVVMEMLGWQELDYPFPLQCFLFLVCSVGVLVMLWLMATNPCEVKQEDVLKVPPREAVTWTWCSYCRLLRPPDAIHCFLCHRCIASIHHHCVALWRCIGKKSLPAFIIVLGALTTVMLVNFLMIKEATVSLRGSIGNYIIASPVLFLLIHSILSLGNQHMWSWRPPQVYPRSAFEVRAPQKPSGVAPFTFSFSGIPSRRGELLRMVFRPLAASKTSPKARKVKQLLQCPNSKCRALANPFWLTGDTDETLECNLCEAAFPLPENTKTTLLDRDLLAERDVHCLLRGQPRPRPRLVFVLDATVPDVRAYIHSWAAAGHGLPDIKVLCYETRTYRLYSNGKVQEETIEGCRSLSTVVDRAWKEVAAHGGRVVFISGREKHGFKIDVLEELVVAASQVTLNMVCVSMQGMDMNPLLQPLVIYHQARSGGSTRLVERSRDVLKLVQSGIFLFWGVMARARVRWTPGVQVVKVHGRGVASSPGQNADSFFTACLDQEKQVEFSLKVDPVTVLYRRRLCDPEDNTVYFQLQMIYTNTEGKAALIVFNRVFNADDGPNDR